MDLCLAGATWFGVEDGYALFALVCLCDNGDAFPVTYDVINIMFPFKYK